MNNELTPYLVNDKGEIKYSHFTAHVIKIKKEIMNKLINSYEKEKKNIDKDNSKSMG